MISWCGQTITGLLFLTGAVSQGISRRHIQLVIRADHDLEITFMEDVGKIHQALLCNRVDSEGVEDKCWGFTSIGKSTVEYKLCKQYFATLSSNPPHLKWVF